MNKNEILKIYGTSYKENAIRLLEKADLASDIGDTSKLIGIKPNLVAPSPADYGSTTHPEVVAGIIEYLQARGYSNIVILEGAWVGDKTSDSFMLCGYDSLCETYGVEFWDMQKDTGVDVDCGGLTLNLCQKALEIDYMINVPVLKGHCQTKVTCALKNMKGLVPNKEKRHFHQMGLHKPVAHLALGIPQDFIVVDHICGDLDFEDGGHAVQTDWIMAAKDPVLVDSYVCKLLHYKTEEVEYITVAEELGVGSTDLSKAEIKVIGEGVATELADRKKRVDIAHSVNQVECCSSCYASLVPVLERLKEEGLLDQLKDTIDVGQGYKGVKGPIGVGNCTVHHDFYVIGCPPKPEKIYAKLKQYILDHAE